jgi:hypothetical protein
MVRFKHFREFQRHAVRFSKSALRCQPKRCEILKIPLDFLQRWNKSALDGSRVMTSRDKSGHRSPRFPDMQKETKRYQLSPRPERSHSRLKSVADPMARTPRIQRFWSTKNLRRASLLSHFIQFTGRNI